MPFFHPVLLSLLLSTNHNLTHVGQNLDNLLHNVNPYLQNIYHINKKIARSVFVADYPTQRELKTIGDHIRKKRIDSHLLQSELAEILKTSKATVANWENNRFEPAIEYMPRIIEFLGYVPQDLFKAKNLAEKIRVFRQIHGLSQGELAKQMGVDPSSIMYWENGKHEPSKKLLGRLDRLIDLGVVVSDADLVSWNDLPETDEQLRPYLSQKIDSARKDRKATFKNCSLCHKTTPPEWMHNESICQSCASGKLGVVY